MGAVGGLLGTSGGASGSGFAAPAAANIVNPTNATQIGNAYQGTQNSLSSQQALLQALQAQNGLNNQNQIYSQLQGVINGTGPNPAQAQLAQATGQNVANQAALMAGQRGAASNVGLIARQAAQQGAATQQGAIGQAATLQAQQSLNALTGAGNIANTQASNQIGQTNANTQAQQAEQQALLNAQQGYNQSQVGSQSSVNAGNTALANTNIQGQQSALGGIANGVSTLFADGGHADSTIVAPTAPAPGAGPTSKFGQFLKKSLGGNQDQSGNSQSQPMTPQASLQNGFSNLTSGILKNLTSSNGPSIGAPEAVVAGGPMDNDNQSSNVMTAAKGGTVRNLVSGGGVQAAKKAEKAVAKGNSYANDKIPAVLSEGEYVLDRQTLQDHGPIGQSARALVAALKKAKGK